MTFSLVISDAPSDPAGRQISIYVTFDALSGPITINADDGRKIRWVIVNSGQAEVVQSASTTYKVTNDKDLAIVGLDPFSGPDSVSHTALHSQKLPVVEPGYSMLGQEGTSAVLSAARVCG